MWHESQPEPARRADENYIKNSVDKWKFRRISLMTFDVG